MDLLKSPSTARNLGAVLLAVMVGCNYFSGALTPQPVSAVQPELEKTELETKTRAAYEAVRPAIERINVGDHRSKVLEALNWNEQKTSISVVRDSSGKVVSAAIYLFYPGVLTAFNVDRYVLPSRTPEKLTEIHLGYLDGLMLRPRRIILFEQGHWDALVGGIHVAGGKLPGGP